MATFHHIVRMPLDHHTTMTIEVEPVYTRQFHVRMWLGLLLMRMAANVLGCNFRIDEASK